MLTSLRPTLHDVGRSGFKDFYMQPGEPVGVRHLCPMGVKALWGAEFPIGEQRQVLTSGQLFDSDN